MYQGIPLEDGNGCGIVEEYLIDILVFLADRKPTTEVNVTIVRVGSDKEPICQFCRIGTENGIQSGRMGAFWVLLLHSFQHFVQFLIKVVPFQYIFLLRRHSSEKKSSNPDFF